MSLAFLIGKNQKLNEKIKKYCNKNEIKLLKQFDNFQDAKNCLEILEPDCLFVEENIENSINFVKFVNQNYSTKTVLFNDFCLSVKNNGEIKTLSYEFLFSNLKNFISEDELCCLDKNSNNLLSLQSAVSAFCLEVGIMPNLSGYRYLVEAIMFVISDAEKYHRLTKKLYPAIAKKFGVNACVVERTIRHALFVAGQSGKLMKLNELIKINVFTKNDRISNGQFISIVADRFLFDFKLKNTKYNLAYFN
ncbi:MAG: sporulation initiation factor Spo0A C-terminal domain-containing protein [Clostridia bacterium]|nr:sporulation initiation factor Spo0A C-terminal domain-containing protein [Clostridia bacterium]